MTHLHDDFSIMFEYNKCNMKQRSYETGSKRKSVKKEMDKKYTTVKMTEIMC